MERGNIPSGSNMEGHPSPHRTFSGLCLYLLYYGVVMYVIVQIMLRKIKTQKTVEIKNVNGSRLN